MTAKDPSSPVPAPETPETLISAVGENTMTKKYKGSYNLVSFARPLGGWFYQFFFAILGAVVISLTFGFILGTLYPFPEIKGYNSVADKVFMILAFFFNIPTGYAIERFIGEWRVKNPRKMVEFMRWYIWYQAMTGIGLVTFMSIYSLNMLNSGNLTYAIWLVLIIVSREYPAQTGVFLSGIKGLQQFDKESVLNFLNDTFIRPGFELAGVIFGKIWGAANPAYGELMGTAIGYAIGTYLDDFVSMYLAARFFRKCLQPMGLTLMDCLYPRVSREVAKTAFIFGLKVSLPGILGVFMGFFSFFWWYDMVPAYATFITLSSLADQLANITKRAEGININATISESYNNGKVALTQYYMAQSWKFYGFFQFGISAVVIAFTPVVIQTILIFGGAENYMLAIPFILPNILHTLIEHPQALADRILLGANRPLYNSIVSIFSTIGGFIMSYLWLFVWRTPQMYGFPVLVWIIPLGSIPIELAALAARWWYIHKRVVPVKMPIWQAFIAPIIPTIIVLTEGWLWYTLLYPLIVAGIGQLLAGMISILFAFIGALMFTYIPLYTFFGGWDNYGLSMFKEAVKLSGPSKIFFGPLYRVSAWLAKKSRLHNRHPIPWQAAAQDAEDLMRVREERDKQIKADKG